MNQNSPDQWTQSAGPERAQVPAEELMVDVGGFEGPLDLLLELARAHKIDLAQVSILALADQYLAFIDRAKILRIDVAGDAAFATDVNWLFDHLRWDVEDDLAKIVGPTPAHELARLARGAATGLRDAVAGVGAMAARLRRGGPAA